MIRKEEKIKERINELGFNFVDKSSIYATAVTSTSFFKLGIGNIFAKSRQQILVFNHEGIVMLAVNDLTGNLLKDYVFLPNEKVQNIRMKFGPFQVALYIDTEEGVLEYKVNRNVYAAKWHNENLTRMIVDASRKLEGK